MMGWIALSLACMVAGYKVGWADRHNLERGRRPRWWL
jgi:hypothetical protein